MKMLSKTVKSVTLMIFCLVVGASCSEDKKIELQHISPPAAKTLMATFPKADIVSVEIEREEGVDFYEVELIQDNEAMEVMVSPEGVIVTIETELDIDQAPKAVADSIYKEIKGGSLIEIEKIRALATFRDGKIVKLEEPVVTYEVEYRKWGRKSIMELTPEGFPL